MKNSLVYARPLTLVFVFISAFIILFKQRIEEWGADRDVLIGGNLIIFAAVLFSFVLLYKAINSPNPQVFIRAMYGSFIVKFFVLAIAAFIYIQVTKKAVNKPALFACIGLYFVYAFLEISALLKLLKNKKNG